MSKKPIYEAFSSLNQIKSKYLKESIDWHEGDFNSKEFEIYLPVTFSSYKLPLTIGVMPTEDEEYDDYEFYFMLNDPKNHDDYELDDGRIAQELGWPLGYEKFRHVEAESINELAEMMKEYFMEIEQEDLDDTLASLMDDYTLQRYNKARGLDESCKTNKKVVKESLSTEEIFERYRLEPRAGYHNNKSWLVAYDTTTDEYVKAEGSKTKYATFKNSKEFIEYIKNLNDEEAEVETTEQETITEERRPPYSDDEMEKYYDMLDESREYQKELRKIDRGIDISRDEDGKFGVNWPARGTQSVEEVEKFVYALDQAAQFCRELNTKYADIL